MTYHEIKGKDCLITIEPRPTHCNRGRYYAKIFRLKDAFMYGTDSNSWPRYYFSLTAAKDECIAWLKENKVYIEDHTFKQIESY